MLPNPRSNIGAMCCPLMIHLHNKGSREHLFFSRKHAHMATRVLDCKIQVVIFFKFFVKAVNHLLFAMQKSGVVVKGK
jgi:hypothetical protein